MNLKEAASRLGLHYQAAYRHVRSGRLPAVKLATGYEISDDAIARFVADDRAWQRTIHPDGRLRRRRSDDPDATAIELAALLPAAHTDARVAVTLVARLLAATVGDSVVVDIDGLERITEHADPRRHLLLAGPGHHLHHAVAADLLTAARAGGTRRAPLLLQRDVPRLAGHRGRSVLDEIGVHSLVVAPVAIAPGQQVVGTVLCSRDRAGRPYGDDDQQTVERYADLVGLAVVSGASLDSEHDLAS